MSWQGSYVRRSARCFPGIAQSALCLASGGQPTVLESVVYLGGREVSAMGQATWSVEAAGSERRRGEILVE